MDINRSNMQTLFTGFNLLFQRGFEAVPNDYLKFTTTVPSTTATEAYPWLEQVGGMREWIGDRQITNLKSQKLDVKNRSFEKTVAVKRDDIEDDKYGLYNPLVQDLGQSAGELWADLATEVLLSAKNAIWIDGKKFFAADRKYSDGKKSSIINNRATAALSPEAYKAARAEMYKYKNFAGQSLKVRPRLLLVGPDNEEMAFEVLKSELTIKAKTDGSTSGVATTKNAWAGTSEYLVIPELGSEWFLLDVTRPVKPVAVQQRKVPKLVSQMDETDDRVFMRGEYLYGADGRGAGFWTIPHLAYASFPDEA